MADWSAFAGVTVVVAISLLVLVRLTNAVMERQAVPPRGGESTDGWPSRVSEVTDGLPSRVSEVTEAVSPRTNEATDGVTAHDSEATELVSLTPGALLGNVAFTHGVFAVVVTGAVVLFEVPWWSLGVGTAPLSTGVGLGVALGLALFVVNQLGVVTAGRFGFVPDESLRKLLAPDSLLGWMVLLGLVLPVVAGFEELLFRGAIVGAVSVGFETSPWALAVVSSVVFALVHETQGRLGMLVTGLLGGVLATAFIVTGDLVVVVVAHYIVNAAEFVAHEAIGMPW